MIEAVSLPPKEVTNEFPSYLWWEWSWSANVEAMPLVFRGGKLFETNRSYLWCNGAALIFIGGHVRKLDCSAYRFNNELNGLCVSCL